MPRAKCKNPLNGCVHCDALQGRFFDHEVAYDAQPIFSVDVFFDDHWASHLEDRDARDISKVPPLADVMQPDRSVPLERRTLVVQCKAWSRGVGKNDIPDIRDILDHYDASGILIAALSVRRSLVEHLSILRKRNIWADYWGRGEIEEQLDANPELARKYPDIVSFSPSSGV